MKALDNEREKAEPVLQSSTSGKSKKKKKKKKKQGEEANSPSQVNGIRSVCKESTKSGKIKLIYLLCSPTLLQAEVNAWKMNLSVFPLIWMFLWIDW